MLAITLICVACSIAAVYPEPSLAYLLLLSLFTPTVIVCQLLVGLSTPDQHMTTLLIALFGAFLGFVIAGPAFDTGIPRRTVWQAIEPFVLPITITPTLGATIFGGAALADDMRQRRRQ